MAGVVQTSRAIGSDDERSDCPGSTGSPDAGRLSRLQRYFVCPDRRAGRGVIDRSRRGRPDLHRAVYGKDGRLRQTLLPGVSAGGGVWQTD
ncbi:hypothetical protein D3C75_1133010 [compost metagenome]